MEVFCVERLQQWDLAFPSLASVVGMSCSGNGSRLPQLTTVRCPLTPQTSGSCPDSSASSSTDVVYT